MEFLIVYSVNVLLMGKAFSELAQFFHFFANDCRAFPPNMHYHTILNWFQKICARNNYIKKGKEKKIKVTNI